MSGLQLRDVRKSFGAVDVIHGVTLDVADGEFVVFVGPSGCGKSTLLRLVAGLEEATGGTIMIDGQDVTEVAPSGRGIAMVFQSYALYPHMTVEENMGFGLKINGVAKDEIARSVETAARILHLEQLLKRKPKQLSGGQRQRVAIGRAIVREPKAFLFDEPLSNLDAELRVQMRLEIARLHQSLKATMIYVTHDQVEAMTLADKIVVLRAGKVEQVGAPVTLYQDPDNLFVGGFIGSPKMNFLKAVVTQRGRTGITITVPALGIAFDKPMTTPVDQGRELILGLRPEHLRLTGPVAFSATIDVVENQGSHAYAYGRTGNGESVVVELREGTGTISGKVLASGFDPATAFLFDAETEMRMR